MTRRLLAAAALTVTLVAGAGPVTSASASGIAGGGDAACVGVHAIDEGVCVNSPVPSVSRIVGTVGDVAR
jgi:hypothetical protein